MGGGDRPRVDGPLVGDVLQRGGKDLTVGGCGDVVGGVGRLVVVAGVLVGVGAVGAGEQGGGLVLLTLTVGALAGDEGRCHDRSSALSAGAALTRVRCGVATPGSTSTSVPSAGTAKNQASTSGRCSMPDGGPAALVSKAGHLNTAAGYTSFPERLDSVAALLWVAPSRRVGAATRQSGRAVPDGTVVVAVAMPVARSRSIELACQLRAT
jgi:hypothetical protein